MTERGASTRASIPEDTGVKRYRNGTHRTVTPEQTLARVRPLMPALGITRVANVTGLDNLGIPVVMVCRPNSRSLSVSQGKGLTLAAAQASGLMEALETYHAERIDRPLKLTSLSELEDSHRLLDVSRLPVSKGSRFHSSSRILWIEGTDLGDYSSVWVPFEVVHADFTVPFPPGSGCFTASTNGLASGNHILEATVHGICEVIERDATALWRQRDGKTRNLTGLDLASVDDEACVEVIERIKAAGLTLTVWDTTTDVGVAAFYCMIAGRRDHAAQTGDGAGCHPDRDVALLRAMTEAVQIRTTYISGARDDIPPGEYEHAYRARKQHLYEMVMGAHAPTRVFSDLPHYRGDTCREDCDWLLTRLGAVGLAQVTMVDLTKDELSVPVVRVVIPGLEGPDEHEGYLPGPRALAMAQGRR